MSAPSRGDTIVGHDVWIGYQALLLPGVTVGSGAVIAAASVVASDVPAYAIVAGNPAQVVRQRFDDADVRRLLRARWWDWPPALITEHARTILAGQPSQLEQLEQLAERYGTCQGVRLRPCDAPALSLTHYRVERTAASAGPGSRRTARVSGSAHLCGAAQRTIRSTPTRQTPGGCYS